MSASVGQMNNSTVWGREEGAAYHALQTPWSFWYDTKLPRHKTNAVDFKANLHKIGSFDTVEHFWKLYVHIKRPSTLVVNANLYLFRDGANIAPMWECFPNGGCWILKLKKRRDIEASVLGKMWQDLVFAAIGEMFEEPDLVGISVACVRTRT